MSMKLPKYMIASHTSASLEIGVILDFRVMRWSQYEVLQRQIMFRSDYESKRPEIGTIEALGMAGIV